MPAYEIPDDLVAMLKARRVIPFIGAGFSGSLNLPGWETLLERIAEEVEDNLTFKQVQEYCNNDNLQIAEYYLLKSDRSIGPLRHTIARSLTNIKPLTSAPHIELINLGTRLVYTTNYDDAIEATYRLLNEPFTVIALPKHVATLDTQKTQIVKYHGDLRHEKTLVLTESSYYSRLDFESPMDLKFRSDILGRSVLFMGYSFRDLNIRVIWYRLMRMMKDIHPSDLQTSYIVIPRKNPVLELLYQEVGIRTIVLDPAGAIKPDSPDAANQTNRLFAAFMFDLADRCSDNGKIPGQATAQFASQALFDRIEEMLAQLSDDPHSFLHPVPAELVHAMHVASLRRIPPHFAAATKNCLGTLADIQFRAFPFIYPSVRLSLNFVNQFGHDPTVTFWIARGLGFGPSRDVILAAGLPWKKVWSQKVPEHGAKKLLAAFKSEIDNHANGHRDPDIAYLADIALRIRDAQIVDDSLTDVRNQASELIARASQLYATVSSMTPTPDHGPDVKVVLAQIEEPAQGTEHTPPFADDIPF